MVMSQLIIIKWSAKILRGIWGIGNCLLPHPFYARGLPTMLNFYDNEYILVDYFSSLLSAELTELEHLSNFFVCI